MTEPRILLVEDEGPLLELISDALALEGFEVAVASSGVEALGMLASAQERYDVIVSDVSMPKGVSGIDLARHALHDDSRARIVLTSGLSRDQLPPLPQEVAFLQKPYRLDQLLDEIRATTVMRTVGE